MVCGTRGHVETVAPTCGQRMDAPCVTCAVITSWEYEGADGGFHVVAVEGGGGFGRTPSGIPQSGVLADALAENTRLRRQGQTAGGPHLPSQYALPTQQQVSAMSATEVARLLVGLGDVLAQANARMREVSMCSVCMEAPRAVVFLPCRHLATCVVCSKALTECSLCRAPIKDRINTF